jgi:hypothetical protein
MGAAVIMLLYVQFMRTIRDIELEDTGHDGFLCPLRLLKTLPFNLGTPLPARARTAQMRTAVGAAFALVLLSGCSSNPVPSLPITGSISSPAQYAVSAAEQNWHCGGLENAIDARVTRIAELQLRAKVESDAAAPTISRMYTRLMDGPGADSPSFKQIAGERAAADAYNDALRAKGCRSIDIDERIAAAPAPTLPAKGDMGPSLPEAPAAIKGLVGGI